MEVEVDMVEGVEVLEEVGVKIIRFTILYCRRRRSLGGAISGRAVAISSSLSKEKEKEEEGEEKEEKEEKEGEEEEEKEKKRRGRRMALLCPISSSFLSLFFSFLFPLYL